MTERCPVCGQDVTFTVLGETLVCPTCSTIFPAVEIEWLRREQKRAQKALNDVASSLASIVSNVAGQPVKTFDKQRVYDYIASVLGESYTPEPPRASPVRN